MKISFQLNGEMRQVEADPWRRLLDVLREELALTGTKEGCGEGECGACTVLVDGKPANACLIPVAQVDGATLGTVEGLANGEVLHEIQRALVDFGGTQCGICTPGIAVAAAHVVEREPRASRERLRELLSGNICRCTGYQLIIDAIIDARDRLAAGGEGGAS